MTGHHNSVMSDVEEVQLDRTQQTELLWILCLELLSGLEPVHKLSHLFPGLFSGADAVYHLHLHSTNHHYNFMRKFGRIYHTSTSYIFHRLCSSSAAKTNTAFIFFHWFLFYWSWSNLLIASGDLALPEMLLCL